MRNFFFLVFIFFGITCRAQEFSSVPDTLRVSNIAQQEGLSQLNVAAFDFDEKGYLWAGTEDGLNRFNGYNMKVFSQSISNEEGLKDDHIRGLLYLNDTLWLGTNTSSLQAYIPSEDKFLDFVTKEEIEANPSLAYAHQIFELNDRFLLVSTLKNAILLDRKSLEFIPVPLPNQEVNDYVLSIAKKSENRFWIGTYHNGILELDLDKKTITDSEDFNSFKNTSVHALQHNSESSLFIGTEKGLFYYNIISGNLEKIYGSGEEQAIRCFYEWNEDYFLVGSYTGVIFLNRNTYEVQPSVITGYKNEVLSPVEVLQIRQDSSKGIWMATQGKGMFYYHPSRQKFTPKRITLPNEPEKDFISIFNFLRNNDTLWMTTQLGFVKHDLSSNTYKLYRTNRLGYTIVEDEEGDIWGGGFNQGLQKYHEKDDFFQDVTPITGIPDRDIAQITPLSKDSIWVSTWSSGIFSVNPKTLEAHPVPINGKSLHRSRASFIGSDKSIWLGADDGLYRIINGKTKKYEHNPNNENSLSNNRIFSITEDDSENLWVGTAKGLNKIELSNNRITRYLEQAGLPNDFIYGVLSDSNGDVWVSTNRGISRLNTETEKFTGFTEADGLQNNEFNGKAAYKDDAGNLYFGGMNGFNIFHPDSIPVNKHVGNTVIEDVELFGTPIEKNIIYTDTLSFNHDENVITFNFSSLNYLLPEKNRYQFKMLGFDKNWRPITRERTTTYTNLNPGTYTFMVKGSNNDLVWGAPDSLTLIIRAPWYATIYFRILAVIALLLLISSIYWWRYSEKKAENIRLQRMVEGRTADLKKSNENLSTAMNLAKEQKENISFLMEELNHRVKNNLQLIASLLDIQKEGISDELAKNNLQAAQNRLFTIATVHDLLSNTKKPEELFKLDEFIKKLATELVQFMDAEVTLEFDLAPLESNKKHVTPLGIIVNELVTNTLKHAFVPEQENKMIVITLTGENGFAVLDYYDSGKGIPADAQNKENSMGLSLIENLSLQLKGQMEILNEKGTRILIRFKY